MSGQDLNPPGTQSRPSPGAGDDPAPPERRGGPDAAAEVGGAGAVDAPIGSAGQAGSGPAVEGGPILDDEDRP